MKDIVSVRDVIANFLAANKFKGFDFDGEGSKLEEKLKETLNDLRALSEKELGRRIKKLSWAVMGSRRSAS